MLRPPSTPSPDSPLMQPWLLDDDAHTGSEASFSGRPASHCCSDPRCCVSWDELEELFNQKWSGAPVQPPRLLPYKYSQASLIGYGDASNHPSSPSRLALFEDGSSHHPSRLQRMSASSATATAVLSGKLRDVGHLLALGALGGGGSGAAVGKGGILRNTSHTSIRDLISPPSANISEHAVADAAAGRQAGHGTSSGSSAERTLHYHNSADRSIAYQDTGGAGNVAVVRAASDGLPDGGYGHDRQQATAGVIRPLALRNGFSDDFADSRQRTAGSGSRLIRPEPRFLEARWNAATDSGSTEGDLPATADADKPAAVAFPAVGTWAKRQYHMLGDSREQSRQQQSKPSNLRGRPPLGSTNANDTNLPFTSQVMGLPSGGGLHRTTTDTNSALLRGMAQTDVGRTSTSAPRSIAAAAGANDHQTPFAEDMGAAAAAAAAGGLPRVGSGRRRSLALGSNGSIVFGDRLAGLDNSASSSAAGALMGGAAAALLHPRRSRGGEEEAAREAAWRWRFTRRWHAEQTRAAVAEPGECVGSAGDGGHDDALQYLAACGGAGANLQIMQMNSSASLGNSLAATTNTLGGLGMLAGADLLIAPSTATSTDQLLYRSLAHAGVGGIGSYRRGSSSNGFLHGGSGDNLGALTATREVSQLNKRAQELLMQQQDLERRAQQQWHELCEPGNQWVGNFLEAVEIDQFGSFNFLLVKVRGSCDRQKILVRGRIGCSAPELLEEVQLKVMHAATQHGVPLGAVQLMGGGHAEWRADRDRHLHMTSGWLADSAAFNKQIGAGPADLLNLASVLTRQYLPAHHRVTIEGQRI